MLIIWSSFHLHRQDYASQLLHECEKFGMSHDGKYNAKKSAIMIFRSATLKGCFIPEFKLKGVSLHVVATYKYLGNYISDDLSDDDDIVIYMAFE